MPDKNATFLHTLLAPARLVSGHALRTGYDMGIAATVSGGLDLDPPLFELSDDDADAIEHAFVAVENAYDAWRWKTPLTDEEFQDVEVFGVFPVRTAADRLREARTRLRKIREAVAEGDRCLAELRRRGFMLIATTQKANGGRPFGSPGPQYPFSALVSADRLP